MTPYYKRRSTWVAAVAVVIIVAVVAVAIGGSQPRNASSLRPVIGTDGGAATTQPPVTQPPVTQTQVSSPATTRATVAPTTRPAPVTTTTGATTTALRTTFGDGTWVVGKQIAAGTYHTAGGGDCYWARESDLSGGTSSILANDTPSGPVTVTILPTDVGFQTQGCGTWSPEPTTGRQATSFGDGVYAVGIDISPGTYSTQGGSNCYWERDSDLTGASNSIITNDTPSGPVTVTIASTDKGFKTEGCGTWKQS